MREPADPGTKTLSAAWGTKPRCPARQPERQLHKRRLDCRGHRGAKMATVAGPGLCENERQLMNQKSGEPINSIETRKALPPVKVRLKRVSGREAIPYPPDGQAREWWQRLRNAFGTTSSTFVAASLQQLIAAARLPYSGISEIAVNASLALIEGAKPQGEIEAALVLQMACTHAAAMAVLATIAGGHGPDRGFIPSGHITGGRACLEIAAASKRPERGKSPDACRAPGSFHNGGEVEKTGVANDRDVQ